MTFEALVPLTLNTKTKGILELKAGDRMDVPPRVIAQLQAQVPDKIRVIPEPPAKDPLLGQRVRYVIPVEKKWQTFTGKCTMVDHANHLGLVEPDQEAYAWRWVALTYIKPLERKEPKL